MSIFSQAVEKVLGKRTVEAIQPVIDFSAPFIIEMITSKLSEDDVNQIMNACRRRLRKTVPQK